MTPLYTPLGGNGASVALRRAAQRHRDCPSGGATAVTGAIPSKNSARNLAGQFLDSEVEMKVKLNIARGRSAPPWRGIYHQRLPDHAASSDFCQILKVGPCY